MVAFFEWIAVWGFSKVITMDDIAQIERHANGYWVIIAMLAA